MLSFKKKNNFVIINNKTVMDSSIFGRLCVNTDAQCFITAANLCSQCNKLEYQANIANDADYL